MSDTVCLDRHVNRISLSVKAREFGTCRRVRILYSSSSLANDDHTWQLVYHVDCDECLHEIVRMALFWIDVRAFDWVSSKAGLVTTYMHG